jgi:nucleotide-binding universal stress UspA family protein
MNSNQNLLFLTNFSEACFQALPAMAEWADREQGTLTLLHVARDERRALEVARDRLNSFFAEGQRYERCERVLLKGDPCEAVQEYCRAEHPDQVFAPASKPSRLPRFRSSLRARLIRCGVKLWTRGRSEGPDTACRVPRNVAYAITGHDNWAAEACEAVRFAMDYEARIHFLYLSPWPDIDDGTIVSDLRLNHPRVSLSDIETLVRRLPVRPELHTTLGNRTSDVVRLLRDCQADAAFVSEAHAIRRRAFRDTMDGELDRLDCEVFCYPRNPVTPTLKRVVSQPHYLRPVETR